MAINYDYMETATIPKFLKKVHDNIYNSSATLKTLMLDGRIVKYLDGGSAIHDPLKYAKETASGVFSGWDTFDVTPPDNLSKAVHSWGNYYASVAISGDDEDQNSGDAQVINLLKNRMEGAETKMKDDLAGHLFEGTGSKGIIGLDTAVNTGSYGGFDGATETWWVSGVDSATHTESQLIDSSDTDHYMHRLFRAASRSCLHLGSKPNLIVTHPLVWDIYESTLQANARYPKTGRGEKIADAGFDVLEWRSTPIVADELCPAGYIFFLNTKYITLYVHPKKNFKFTGFKVPTNQDGRIGQILLKTQLTLNNRRMHYKGTGYPTS